jgi:hypothetical protein
MTNTDRRYGVSDALAWKAPVRAATTGNIALSGEQTIDGLACVEGDRVLVWQQTAGRENGIYVVSTGNWRRAADADGMRDLATGTMLVVTGGSSYQWAIFQLMTTGDIAIDDTALTFQTLSVQVAGSFRATSVTSLPISVGAKTFAIEANRAFTAGDYVIAKSDANANNFMVGQVTSYGGTTLVVDVEAIGGSGTHAGWSSAISVSPGATGATGAPGPAGPAVSGIGDVPGLAAALDAKLDDSQTGAVGLNVLAATTQAAGRAAINAASDDDVKLSGCRAIRLFNRTTPNGPSYHPAFLMEDGSVTVCGQPMASLGHGDNIQALLLPSTVVLPEGLLGTPVDVVVTTGQMYILTNQGDVCAAGYNAEGQLGDNSTTTRSYAVLLNASDITPRSVGGANRAVTKIETTEHLNYSTSVQSVSTFFVCADGSLWATGYHGTTGVLAGGIFGTNALKPTRCLKTANSTTQATSEGTASSTTITPSVAGKTFAVSAGKSWVAGDPIFIYSHASTAVWMFGSVTSYSGTTLIMNVTAIGTATSSSDWIISELVNDAANVYASGGVTASVGYITTLGRSASPGGCCMACTVSARPAPAAEPLRPTSRHFDCLRRRAMTQAHNFPTIMSAQRSRWEQVSHPTSGVFASSAPTRTGTWLGTPRRAQTVMAPSLTRRTSRRSGAARQWQRSLATSMTYGASTQTTRPTSRSSTPASVCAGGMAQPSCCRAPQQPLSPRRSLQARHSTAVSASARSRWLDTSPRANG